MPKLIFLKGLPGSGKSTWAKEEVKNSKGKIKRVNKDDLRLMIDSGEWSKKNEKMILLTQWVMVMDYLAAEYDVIVDNTNFHKNHLEKAESIVHEFNEGREGRIELEIKFFDTPLEECIRRDSLRPNPVGRNVIMQMYNQYLRPEPIKHNPELPDCIIVDLDGTLCLGYPGCNWYDRDFSLDEPGELVIHLLRAVVTTSYRNYSLETMELIDKEIITNDPEIIFMSGRKKKYYGASVDWILKHLSFINPEFKLFMREDNDNRGDEIIKRELYDQHIKGKYNVKFAVDDRPRIVRLWRSMGIFVFDVNQRNEEF